MTQHFPFMPKLHFKLVPWKLVQTVSLVDNFADPGKYIDFVLLIMGKYVISPL